jgi:hypothetical protein
MSSWYPSHTYYYHTNDPDAVLAYPHYSCPVFSKHKPEGHVIYGTGKGSHGDYTDRLWQWDYTRAQAASGIVAVEFVGVPATARRFERWLSLYKNTTVRITRILAGSRPDNGYPWYYLEYEDTGIPLGAATEQAMTNAILEIETERQAYGVQKRQYANKEA